METTELNPRQTPTGNGSTPRLARKRFDPTQLFAQRDRLPWFWFFVAVIVTVLAALDRYHIIGQFKQRERVVIIDPAQTYYISPLLQFQEAKDLHVQQAELAALTFLARNSKDFDHPDLLRQMFLKSALQKAHDHRTREAVEFRAKQLHQKPEIAKIDILAIRRLEDLDSTALTYAEVKAIASGNPLVIEKAQVDAELIRLTRLRSAHAEEQYRIRSNLRRSHEDAEAFTGRLTNLRQDIAARQDTSGDKFSIELDGQTLDNRGIAGELIVRRAEKIKNRFGDDVRVGRFAGFDLFLRPSFNNTVEMIVRGKNSYAARVTDTAQGTIRSLEANVQGFEERATRLETDIADATKRAKELETNVGAHFEREERYQQLTRRQSEIEEKLDLTKNQAPSQVEADSTEANDEKKTEKQTQTHSPRPKRRAAISV
jgi:hypothetical protein